MQKIWADAETFDSKTERLFRYLQVFTACAMSFAHGSNDVANAMGPFAAVYQTWSTGSTPGKGTRRAPRVGLGWARAGRAGLRRAPWGEAPGGGCPRRPGRSSPLVPAPRAPRRPGPRAPQRAALDPGHGWRRHRCGPVHVRLQGGKQGWLGGWRGGRLQGREKAAGGGGQAAAACEAAAPVSPPTVPTLPAPQIMAVLAVKSVKLTNSRGFVVELATAMTVVLASRFGLPVSTTQVVCGAVMSMGLMEGGRGVNWRMAARIAVGWVLTLCVACAVSAAFASFGVYTPSKAASMAAAAAAKG